MSVDDQSRHAADVALARRHSRRQMVDNVLRHTADVDVFLAADRNRRVAQLPDFLAVDTDQEAVRSGPGKIQLVPLSVGEGRTSGRQAHVARPVPAIGDPHQLPVDQLHPEEATTRPGRVQQHPVPVLRAEHEPNPRVGGDLDQRYPDMVDKSGREGNRM